MKIVTALFTLAVVFSACNTDKDNDPVPCTCDEVIDKEVLIQGQPQPVYQLAVQYCDINGPTIEQVSPSEYSSVSVGDCY